MAVFVIFVILTNAQRSPAPVIEEQEKPSPTVAPKAKVIAKPKPKAKPTPASFAGIWSGVTNGACSNDGVNHSGALTITVSADERTVSWQSGGSTAQRPCSRNGDLLLWDDSNDVVTSNSSVRVSRDGKTLAYSARSTITTWPLDGVVCTGSGTLTKR